MVPKQIRPYFETTHQKKDGDCILIEGILTCCNSYDFEVFVVGKIKRSILSKMYLIPENDIIVLKVRCKKCGKVISVFDSSCDGYDQCEKNQPTSIQTKTIDCKVCRDGVFSVGIKYEYYNIQECDVLELTEIDNAFSWIWITLKCNKCGTRYRNFIDYETG